MRRRLFTCAVLLTVGTAALAAKPVAVPMTTWSSEKYSLSVTHPTAWKQELGVCGYAILGLRPTVEPDPKKRFRGMKPGSVLVSPIIYIVGTPAPAGATRAEDALDAVMAMVSKDRPAAEFRKPTPATVAGLPGLKVVFDQGEKVLRRSAIIYTVRDGAIVGLEMMSDRAEFAENDKAATVVLKSFAWTNGAATQPAKP